MSITNYHSQKAELYRSIVSNTSRDSGLRTGFQFNIVSASLSNFLPDLPPDRHLRIYKEILFHQQLSLLDMVHPQAFNDLQYSFQPDALIEQLRQKPGILLSFHTGSYRLLNHLLLKHQVPFILVLASAVMEAQGTAFRDIAATYANPGSRLLECVEAENPMAARRLLSALAKGKSLLVYADGNTGAASGDNRLPLTFLNNTIGVRKGIGLLAYLAHCPIHCLASTIENNENILHHFGSVSPRPGEGRDSFIKRALEYAYRQLAGIVRHCPGQWEAWLYLHKVVHQQPGSNALPSNNVFETPARVNLYRLNSNEFAIFILDGQYFLLHKRSYTFYQIDQQLFDCLSRSQFDTSSISEAGTTAAELLSNGVIMPACLSV